MLKYHLKPLEIQGVIKLMAFIKEQDDLDYNSGSCGDGNFDNKMRELEHKEKLTTIKVIKQMLG